MITQISLVTLCHHTKFCNVIDYISYVVHYIPTTICFITGSLCLLISLTYFTHPLIPLNPFSLIIKERGDYFFKKDCLHHGEKLKILLRSETFNYCSEKLASRSDFSQEFLFCMMACKQQ